MNRADVRQIASAGLIACGVCAAAWMFTSRPVRAEAAQSAERARQARERAEEASALSIDAAASLAALERAQERRRVMLELSSRTGDAMSLYEQIGALAAGRGLEMDRARPAAVTARIGKNEEFPGDAVAYTLTVRGGYEAVARFVGDLERELGFSACLRVQLAPEWRAGEALVTATIETLHLRVDAARAAAAPAKAKGKGARR